ncbi:hypothetical protein K1719_014852 [Acacia pycnantha]|nr:hypothetical protein K1719_014852 [Acacia pycnantha]
MQLWEDFITHQVKEKSKQFHSCMEPALPMFAGGIFWTASMTDQFHYFRVEGDGDDDDDGDNGVDVAPAA